MAMPLRHAVLAGAVAVVSAPGLAGPLVISPTTVTIPPGRHSAVIEIENPGETSVDLQFRAYDWEQANGTDRLTPTDALLVSPAIATVPPHGKQVFRILQTAGPMALGARERSYRLRLNQLPRAGDAAVAILLEFSLPVFQSQAGAVSRLSWRTTPEGVTVTNTGDRRARIGEVALRNGDVTTGLEGAAAIYLLSGSSRTFRLSSGSRMSDGARLVGTTDTGPIDAPGPALAAR
jgi:fimbrial chaperone protein